MYQKIDDLENESLVFSNIPSPCYTSSQGSRNIRSPCYTSSQGSRQQGDNKLFYEDNTPTMLKLFFTPQAEFRRFICD